MGRLKGKVAFITGAGAGIGRTAALLFAKEGAGIVVAERDERSGQATCSLLSDAGAEALFVQTDVTDDASVREAVTRAVVHFGKIDVLYNNAGGSTTADDRVTDCPIDEFWRKIKLDLFGTWLVCRHGMATMLTTGGGSVINSSSVFALIGTQGKDAYTAAKGGVAALTRSMAVEYAAHHIRVNALAPGATRTERVVKLLERDRYVKDTLKGQLLGLVEPIEVAQAALYLASDDSRMTTGQILTIDGGFSVA